MRKLFRSRFTALLLGGFWGGIVGAIMNGLLTFFHPTSYPLWLSKWFPIIWGLVSFSIIGGILGAFLGIIQANRRTGFTVGIVLGGLIFIGSFDAGVDLAWHIAMLVSFSMLGWLIASSLPSRT